MSNDDLAHKYAYKALHRFGHAGVTDQYLYDLFAEAMADARRAALETLHTRLVVRFEGYRDRTTGGFPEAQAVRMTLDDAVEIVDDEITALLDAAPKPEEATRFPPAVVCRKRTMDPSYPCTCSVCSVKP